MELLAKTYHGLEQVLAHELRALGAKQVQERKRAVSFVGDRTLIYKVNLHVRTAIRVLMQIDQFVARTEQQLYRGIEAIDWSKFLQVSGSLAIDAVVQSPHFRHSQYAALKTKDAIVDQFRKKYKRRPSVNLENPDLRINLHISGDRCTVSLDSSGVSLHKRGYRKGNHPAHLSEVLAAGMILLSGLERRKTFYRSILWFRNLIGGSCYDSGEAGPWFAANPVWLYALAELRSKNLEASDSGGGRAN